MDNACSLGVDIGGSHITAAVVDLNSGLLNTQSIVRMALDASGDKIYILDVWCEVINQVDQELRSLGIAMPGPFDYENGICLIQEQDKFKSLYQVNLKKELSRRLEIEEDRIRFINDAAGFLQGEIFAGAAKEQTSVLGITLGTGLGSALYLNNQVEDAGLWNAAFLNGMAEDHLSTRWFIRRYQQLSGSSLGGVKELVERIDQDHHATQVFMEFGYNLAQFLIPVIQKNNVELVIIGGDIAKSFSAFKPALTSTLSGNHVKVGIKVSELKEHAALIGAAFLAV